MDNLTHSLIGALIGQTGLKKKTGLGMPALIIGANIPDIDATCTIYGLDSLAMRRGITHGPPAMILLPLVLAGLLYGYDRWQVKRGKRPEGRLPVHFGWLYVLALIGCLSHPFFDWLNSYGVRLLEPFSSQWFYGDAIFIIDIWLWIGLGFATWLSLRRERQGRDYRTIAQIALGAVLFYVSYNIGISWLMKRDSTPTSVIIPNPVPVAFWNREVIRGDGQGAWLVEGQFVGDVPLDQCDLAAARRADKTVDAFLFWSRAPYVQQSENGEWVLGDARFVSRGTGRFSVILPPGTCVERPEGQ